MNYYTTANGGTLKGSGNYGDIVSVPNSDPNFKITDIEIIPEAAHTLASVYKFLSAGQDVWFDHTTMTGYIGILAKGEHKVYCIAPERNGTFRIKLSHNPPVMLWRES